MAELSKSNPQGMTLGGLRALLVDAARLDLTDETKVYARTGFDFSLTRPPSAVLIVLQGEPATTTPTVPDAPPWGTDDAPGGTP